MTLVLNLNVYINFSQYFPRLLADLGEMRYKNSAISLKNYKFCEIRKGESHALKAASEIPFLLPKFIFPTLVKIYARNKMLLSISDFLYNRHTGGRTFLTDINAIPFMRVL